MKCQILFSKKNKKDVISLSSAEYAHNVISVKHSYTKFKCHLCLFLNLPLFKLRCIYRHYTFSTKCISTNMICKKTKKKQNPPKNKPVDIRQEMPAQNIDKTGTPCSPQLLIARHLQPSGRRHSAAAANIC